MALAALAALAAAAGTLNKRDLLERKRDWAGETGAGAGEAGAGETDAGEMDVSDLMPADDRGDEPVILIGEGLLDEVKLEIVDSVLSPPPFLFFLILFLLGGILL
jgi:hypothetical protein